MFREAWHLYVSDFLGKHSAAENIVRFVTLFTILTLAVIALRIVGKKSVSQLTLINVITFFIFTSTMGALITKPKALFVALEIAIFIIIFGIFFEWLQLKFNPLEAFFNGRAAVIVKDGKYDSKTLKKNKLSIDMLESQLRLQGVPSIEACKTVTIEPNGALGVEIKPEYEPIKKIYFDAAIEQILKLLDSTYLEKQPPEMKNIFDEVKGKASGKDAKE